MNELEYAIDQLCMQDMVFLNIDWMLKRVPLMEVLYVLSEI